MNRKEYRNEFRNFVSWLFLGWIWRPWCPEIVCRSFRGPNGDQNRQKQEKMGISKKWISTIGHFQISTQILWKFPQFPLFPQLVFKEEKKVWHSRVTGYSIFRRNGVSWVKSDHMAWGRLRWTPRIWPRSLQKSFFVHFLTTSSDTVKFIKQATGKTWTLSNTKFVVKKTSRNKAPHSILGRNIHTLPPIWSPHRENETFWNITDRLTVACL